MYKVSEKALFNFVLKCSLDIEEELMAKYIENPINAFMFVEYK